jgi:N,N'-diacetyllegionaminate synthase
MNLTDERTTIIAEVGTNHNGDLGTAQELIKVSAQCGADVVKFQSFLVDELLAEDDENYQQLKMLQLPREWYPVLMDYCNQNGVTFLSTATNFTTIEWMEECGVEAYKVASCNISHILLIEKLVTIGKPVIFSTGLVSLDELIELDRYLQENNFSQYAFLHCVSRYPTLYEDLHLGNIKELKRLFQCPIGFSDHSMGITMPVAAVALGASIIEKHISLDRKGIGMDHEVALLPDQFNNMCEAIRNTERALVTDMAPDSENMFAMRRSLHYSRDLSPGDRIRERDVKIVRPEDGLLPKEIGDVIGKRVKRSVRSNQPVRREDIEH